MYIRSIFLSLFLLVLSVPLSAQNKIFEKYSSMEHTEYVCITKSMLSLLDKSSATINGVHIEGITDAIHTILIVNSKEEKTRRQMMTDFSALTNNPDYSKMVDHHKEGESVTTLIHYGKGYTEIIMYIVEDKGEQTFIVLTGEFTKKQLNALLNNF